MCAYGADTRCRRKAATSGEAFEVTKPRKYKHIECLVRAKSITTNDGVKVSVFDLDISRLDTHVLRRWAKHFREHYCLDSKIDALMQGGPCRSRSEYLLKQVFPSTEGFGPAIRSSDFTEILIADFVESVLDFWVPRTRYRLKQIPNESPKGSDIVGLKFANGIPSKASPDDAMVTFEVKGLMKPKRNVNKLQEAIDDAKKDSIDKSRKGDAKGAFRVGATLNSLKQRYIDVDDDAGRKAVERFQEPLKRPYIQKIGASAVFCSSAFDETTVRAASTATFPPGSKPMLIVVRGAQLMKLIHEMYERAANEA